MNDSNSDRSEVRFRPEVVQMRAYVQGKPANPGAFKLSSNENPFQPLPSVVAAVSRASGSINRYPDGSAKTLRGRIATEFGVGEDSVELGAGSVSVLQSLISAVAGPGDEIIYAWRSFEAYPTLVTVAGATAVTVPNSADGAHNLDAMAATVTERTRAIILCTPNNPTGPALTTVDVEGFVASVPSDVLIIIDEAYIDFVTNPAAVDGSKLLADHANVVTVRTFSKAYGLAGLRVGYVVGHPEVIAMVHAVSTPLSVTNLAQLAAVASMDAEDELQERVGHLVDLRNRLAAGLTDQGWRMPDAQGNFVWLALGEVSPKAMEVFERHTAVARQFLDEGVRISIGEDESIDSVLAATAEIKELFGQELGAVLR